MQQQESFILIDDDVLSGQLFEIIIRHVSKEAKAFSFNDAEEALAFLATEVLFWNRPALLFVDVNMPFLSGWEFLDKYDKLDAKIKAQLRIYMQSSSIDQNDNKRALADKNVTGYLEKPLTIDVINGLRLKN